ncbi:hypothetical protein LTS10_010114 [Elasticomyces elasticus]|nr:hypothetical protein LTS10_010114 [Elasticomyces elasticus]
MRFTYQSRYQSSRRYLRDLVGMGMGRMLFFMLAGINDCWYTKDENSTAADSRADDGVYTASRFGNLLGGIWRQAPDALILASTLPRNLKEWEDECICSFNTILPSVIRRAASKGQQIRMVNMYDVLPTSEMHEDGTHLTDHGYQLMAQHWYDALYDATNISA